MKKSVALPFACLALASLIAVGCSGNSNQAVVATGTPTPIATPSTACTSPPGYSIQEVFPQNNGANQANLQGVVFAIGPSPQPATGVPSPLPTNWYFYVNTSLGTTTAFTQNIAFLGTPTPLPSTTALASGSPAATPTPLPTPSDVPSPGFGTNYIYEAATLGIFANSATFTVFLANTNCFPGIQYNKFTTATYDLPTPTPSPTASST